jgi:hypothetical protein
VEQHRVAPLYGEQHVGNPAATEVGANLEEPIADRTTGRHTDWPAKLDGSDIVTDGLAVFGTKPRSQSRTGCARHGIGRKRLAASSHFKCTKNGSIGQLHQRLR